MKALVFPHELVYHPGRYAQKIRALHDSIVAMIDAPHGSRYWVQGTMPLQLSENISRGDFPRGLDFFVFTHGKTFQIMQRRRPKCNKT
jgi:hypothetical protein